MLINLFSPKKTTPKTRKKLFTEDFIDIHSHLLPGIDDGAKNIDESIALLTKMHKLGIHHFVCTPHVMGEVWENSTEKIVNTYKVLKCAVSQNSSLQGISLRVAAEYMLDENFCKLLENKDLLTIKDNLILVEMSYLSPPANLFEMIAEIQFKGFLPILAHPERYKSFHRDLKVYEKLKIAGCLFQVNLVSLTNYYGKDVNETAQWLLRSGLIDFTGSDLHHMRHMDQIESLMERHPILDILKPIVINNHRLK